jgi:hypothetical protein
MEGSQKFSLNTTDLKKIGKGAIIAISGALLVYLTEVVPNVDFGAYTPVAVALSGILVNAAYKFIADYSKN